MNGYTHKNFVSASAPFKAGLTIASPVLDVEWLPRYARGWEVEVRQARKSNRLQFTLEAVHSPHIQFGKNRYSSALLSKGGIPKGCVVLVYIQTSGIVNYRNKKYRPDELILVTPDDEIDMTINTQNVAYTLTVEARLFEESFFAHYGRSYKEEIVNRHFKFRHDAADRFLGSIHRWMKFFRKCETLDRPEFDFKYLEQQFLHELFGFLEPGPIGKTRSDTVLLKRARELLHDSLDMYLTINEMSEMLGVSQRTLEHVFKHNLGMGPKNYLQILRLHAAREDLLRADPADTKVADIALKYAFFHMSHFAAEYKKLFGETPSQTFRR